MDIKYSICICNYNMSTTLTKSLTSIVDQLTDDYEVIVVDDGSSDNSLELLINLSQKYHNFRVIPLLRDNRRKLGETRNISIRAAKGEYVLLHLDTDDLWENHICSFAKIYHGLEERLKINNFMLSGHQIHMSTKKLLIENSYPNIYYVEDRLLWNKLAVLGKLYCIDHKVFRKRIPLRTRKLKIIKAFSSQFSSMSAAYSYSPNHFQTTIDYIKMILTEFKKSKIFSLITFLILVPSFINGFLLKRTKLISQVRPDYRKHNLLDLKKIEDKYISEFGLFKLSDLDRSIYFEKK